MAKNFNSIVKELKKEINIAKIGLDADEWILRSKSWLGVYYRKGFAQYLENPAMIKNIKITPKQNSDFFTFFYVFEHKTTSSKSIFFHFYHPGGRQPDASN